MDFRLQVGELLRRRRYDIVCDCLAFLRSEPVCTLKPENRDRWQAWQDAVLTRMPNGDAVAAAIIARRPEVDADACEAQDIFDALANLLKMRGHCPKHESVFIPFKVARELLEEDMGTRSKTGFGRKLKVACQQGTLRTVTPGYRHGYFGTGLLWRPTGPATDTGIKRLHESNGRSSCTLCGGGKEDGATEQSEGNRYADQDMLDWDRP